MIMTPVLSLSGTLFSIFRFIRELLQCHGFEISDRVRYFFLTRHDTHHKMQSIENCRDLDVFCFRLVPHTTLSHRSCTDEFSLLLKCLHLSFIPATLSSCMRQVNIHRVRCLCVLHIFCNTSIVVCSCEFRWCVRKRQSNEERSAH